MSKPKEIIENIRSQYFDRQKDKIVEEANKTLEEKLEHTVYDVIQDPSTKSRQFIMVKIKYDLVTKQAVVSEVTEFQDKAAGLTIQMDKENRKYLFEKNSRSKK